MSILGIIQPSHNESRGEGGIDFCYGALRKLRYGALQGGEGGGGGLKSSKTGVT